MMLLNHVSIYHVVEYTLCGGGARANEKDKARLMVLLAYLKPRIKKTRDCILQGGKNLHDTYNLGMVKGASGVVFSMRAEFPSATQV